MFPKVLASLCFLSAGLLFISGCGGGGIHLSDSDAGSPAGTPRPIGAAALTPRQDWLGSGSGLYSSGKFKVYGGTTFIQGNASSGTFYRMEGSDLNLGRNLLGGAGR